MRLSPRGLKNQRLPENRNKFLGFAQKASHDCLIFGHCKSPLAWDTGPAVGVNTTINMVIDG
jgi:hypothetical protein